MALTIRTNNVPRDILHWQDLTAKERKDFDYLDCECKQEEAEFFRYKKHVYHLGDMDRGAGMSSMPDAFKSWDFQSDSFFSGILIRYVDDFERVVCATYTS